MRLDKMSFDKVVRAYGRLIRAAVVRVGGPRAAELGDDIEQRVLVGLWRQCDREQTIDHPSSYIYRAAVRETVRVLKEEQRLGSTPVEAMPLPERAITDPHGDLEAKEVGEHISMELGRLSDDRCRAVKAHLAGFQVQEIMAMYDWTYNKARNLISRGLADLRRGLRGQGYDG